MLERVTNTAIGSALAKAVGYNANEARLRADIARYLNNGGSSARLMEVVRECVETLPDEGPTVVTGDGHSNAANIGQPNEGKAVPGVPIMATNPVPNLPASAKPARLPFQSQADIRAARDATKVVALSAFDRELTHTGRKWGNVIYRELDSLREDGDIADGIKVRLGALSGDDRHKQIRELMTPREFLAVLRKVRS